MNIKSLLRSIVSASLILSGAIAHAGILLDKSIVEFPANEPPRQDITVSNQGDEMAYVSVEVLAVINPGTDKEERKAIGSDDDIKFVASPAKLAIPPGGRKQVRLVNLGDAGGERIYRINFTPVLPPLQKETEGMGVRVVIAYQVLAIIQPPEPVDNIDIKKDPISLVLKNKGNTNALITNVSQCDKNAENCQNDLGSTRLYPGNTMTVALPYKDTPVTLKMTNFKGTREEVVR